MAAHRIVSLLPSTTEIACALGFEDELVGRSHECDYPSSVVGLPVCTAPRFDVEGSSRQIDDRVVDLVRRGLSVYDVDAEKLRELAPTAVLTQDQCEVCAASLDDVTTSPAVISGGPVTSGAKLSFTQSAASLLDSSAPAWSSKKLILATTPSPAFTI